MKISKELYDHFDQLGHSLLNEKGQEVTDPRPMFVPGHVKPLTITEQIQRLMRVELSRQAAEQGEETFQDADDLEPDDEPDDLSRYQQMDPDPAIVALGRKQVVEKDSEPDLDQLDLDLDVPQEDKKSPEGDAPDPDPKPSKKTPPKGVKRTV